jgi:hypothetical protein
MGWHTPDEYFEHHVLPHKSYDEVKQMLELERDGVPQMTGMEQMHRTGQDDKGSFGNMIAHYGFEQTVAFLDQAEARRQERRAEYEAEQAARPATFAIEEDDIQLLMAIDEAWRAQSGREDGPATTFLFSFDPSITFQNARLTLTQELIDALAEMKGDLYRGSFFRMDTGRYGMLEALNDLLTRLEQALKALPAGTPV